MLPSYADSFEITHETTDTGLKYKAKNRAFSNDGIEGNILWHQLPDDFPRTVKEILANKKRWLPFILTISSINNHSLPLAGVCDEYKLEGTRFRISDQGISVCRSEVINAHLMSGLLTFMAFLGLDALLDLTLSKKPHLVHLPLRLHMSGSMLNAAIDGVQLTTVKKLIEAQADVNFKPTRFVFTSWHNATLDFMSMFDRSPLTTFLLSLLIDPFENNKLTAWQGILDLLLTQGADIDLPAFFPPLDTDESPRIICRTLLAPSDEQPVDEESRLTLSQMESLTPILEKIVNFTHPQDTMRPGMTP